MWHQLISSVTHTVALQRGPSEKQAQDSGGAAASVSAGKCTPFCSYFFILHEMTCPAVHCSVLALLNPSHWCFSVALPEPPLGDRCRSVSSVLCPHRSFQRMEWKSWCNRWRSRVWNMRKRPWLLFRRPHRRKQRHFARPRHCRWNISLKVMYNNSLTERKKRSLNNLGFWQPGSRSLIQKCLLQQTYEDASCYLPPGSSDYS